MSPVNSLGWPTRFLSVLVPSHQVPLLCSCSHSCLLFSFASPAPTPCLCEGHITLPYTLDPSSYSLRLVFLCPLHMVEKHVGFYLRKAHHQGGRGMTSRKAVPCPSPRGMRDMHLGADSGSLLYGMLWRSRVPQWLGFFSLNCANRILASRKVVTSSCMSIKLTI